MVISSLKNTPSASLSPLAATSKARLRLWLSLLRASKTIETEIRDRLRLEFGATLPRFDVMAALFRQPEGMAMSSLSKFLMVSNGNVTGIVDRLVRDGLVERSQPDGDRRSWVIKLTLTGTQSFKKMATAHERWIDELLSHYDGQEANILSENLLRTNKEGIQND